MAYNQHYKDKISIKYVPLFLIVTGQINLLFEFITIFNWSTYISTPRHVPLV